MNIKPFVLGTALFATGVLGGNRVKHALANTFTRSEIPYVAVNYNNDGAYVNGMKVVGNRIGAPRCDWNELSDVVQEEYITDALSEDRSLLHDYLRSASAADQRHVALYAIVQLSRSAGSSVVEQARSIADELGYRTKQ